MNQQDSRALLGLPETFTRAELASAYRRMVRLVHPDRMVDASLSEKADATALLGRVNRANEVLEKALAARSSFPLRSESPPEPPRQSSAPTRSSQSTPPEHEQRHAPKPPPMTYEQFRYRLAQETWSRASTVTTSPSAPRTYVSPAWIMEDKRKRAKARTRLAVISVIGLVLIAISIGMLALVVGASQV